ncbi:MAG: prolipoprotein diacylglyceryl transferase [Candidatus Babeliaceae bacterium]|nr:prolipoprotein diacylglyceryl transferase [Candidatus Babeliaceae bacterium]
MVTFSFNPEIVHILGPFSVHIYGIFVALGISAFIALSFNHSLRKKYISSALYEKLIIFTSIIALVGARALHIASEWGAYHTFTQMISVWNGGLSILGAIAGGLTFVPLFLWYYKISVLPILDLGALYIPLAQAIARLGCLFGGCCFGCATASTWSIIYTHASSHAPLNTPLIPTQLYSSLIYGAIFIVLQLIYRNFKVQPGMLAGLYLIFSSLERFAVDFYRGDRIINSIDALIYTSSLSLHQWISLGLICVGMIFILFSEILAKKNPATRK